MSIIKFFISLLRINNLTKMEVDLGEGRVGVGQLHSWGAVDGGDRPLPILDTLDNITDKLLRVIDHRLLL